MHDGIHGDFTFAKALYLAVNLGIGVGYSNVYPEHQAAMYVCARSCVCVCAACCVVHAMTLLTPDVCVCVCVCMMTLSP